MEYYMQKIIFVTCKDIFNLLLC